jgi:hypothetical protein
MEKQQYKAGSGQKELKHIVGHRQMSKTKICQRHRGSTVADRSKRMAAQPQREKETIEKNSAATEAVEF